MADLMDAYWRLPPVARTLATATFVTSVCVYMDMLPFRWFYFDRALLLNMPPELWRLASNFLITDPKLSILLDPYFVFSYTKQLEVGNPRISRREDLVWYLTFVCTVTLLIGQQLTGAGYYLQGLIVALAYTCTQDQRGIKATFIFFTIPAQLVPYAMMLVSLIMHGPHAALVQLCGLLAAHLYDFMTRLWPEFGGGANLAPTPAFMSRLVASPFRRVEDRGIGQVFRGTGRTTASASGSSTGASTGGPLPDAWKARGKGQRLGG